VIDTDSGLTKLIISALRGSAAWRKNLLTVAAIAADQLGYTSSTIAPSSARRTISFSSRSCSRSR
jgi:hypothetical protein